MKKKFLVMFVTLALGCAVGLIACGGGNNSGSGSGSGDKPTDEHKHNYISTVIDPTCTESGYTLHTCDCGDSYKDNYVDGGHDFTEYYSSSGCNAREDYIFRICKVCETVETKEEVVHPHEYEFIEPTVPTCTEFGILNGVKCKNCGNEAAVSYIAPLGHRPGDRFYNNTSNHYVLCERDGCGRRIYSDHRYTQRTVTRASTCTTDGVMQLVCGDCGHTKTNVIEARHYWREDRVIESATCTQSGTREDRCARCNTTATRPIPALGHSWGECTVITPPTCTEDGEGSFECSRCGETKTEALPHGHNFGDLVETVRPTCTTSGTVERTCSVCGEKETETVSPRHSFDDGIQITAPTCTQSGTELYTCTLCGVSEIRDVDALGHAEQEITERATCTQAGYTMRECVRCGEIIGDYEVIDALGHLLEYDSDADGHWQECTRSDCDYVSEKEDHRLELRAVKERGNGEWLHKLADVCEVCGYEKNVRSVVHEHEAVEIIQATATCTRPGLSAGLKCAVPGCEDILIQPVEIAALGHLFADGVCVRCGADYCDSLQTVGLEYTLNRDKTSYSCTGLGTATEKDIVIARTHNGLPVTVIGEGAFSDCSLTSITIPDGVTSIGSSAFDKCSGLASVIYTGDIKGWCSIKGLSAFNGYYPTLIIDGKVITGELVIPNSVTSIESDAFRHCSSLTSIIIPDSVTSIGGYAFFGCNGLSSIIIPSSVTKIWNLAFGGCSNLTSINVEHGNTKYHSQGNCLIETNSKTLVLGCKTSVIPTDGSVTSIGYDAFYDSGLTSITIPDSVTTIGMRAFCECRELTSVTIGRDVTYIADDAFFNCISLQYNEYDNAYYLGNESNRYVALIKAKNRNITSCKINDNTKLIANGAFDDCSSLTSITIPDGVTIIGYYRAFDDCSSLQYNEYDNAYYLGNASNRYVVLIKAKNTDITSCKINDNTKQIVDYAFYNCSSLTSITIPDSVTSIGGSVFRGCSSLTSITISDSVTSIGMYAFYGCSSLTSITIPNSLTSIGECMFYGFWGLTSITIPNSVTSIGWGAFYGCGNLTSITIPDSVTSIGGSAFYNCSSLTSITIPDSVTSIGDSVFSGCNSLTSITIPDSVTSIGSSAFHFCGLTSITIPDGVTSIGSGAFYGCGNLTSITIPNSVTSIGYNAFYNCPIENATIPAIAISSIPQSNLKTVVINGGDSIEDRAFYGCGNLTSITIPDSVTSIGSIAFSGCWGLTSITFQGTRSQWRAISKGSGWNNYTGNYTVHCTDGGLSKDGTEL